VFIAGDAAHIHSPVGGQGMNTGLQDAANLAWKLILALKYKGAKKLLETYEKERWPVGQKLLHFTDRIFEKISSQKPFVAQLRNYIAPLIINLIDKNRYFKKKAFRFVSELGIHYPSNSFLCNDLSDTSHPFPKHISAGYRAPNGIIKRNLDLFSLINGYQFHLLVLSKKALSLEEINIIASDLVLLKEKIQFPLQIHFIAHSLVGENAKIIQAQTNQVFENYGLSNKNSFGVFLIRPDGYIAYRSDAIKMENLRKFCDKFVEN
jgi:hypothetical protein